MRKFISLQVLFCLVIIVTPLRAQWTSYTVVDHGTTDSRINILLVSEGYTEAELELFRTDVLKVTNDILGEYPFSAYREYFRVIAVEVASNESGASNYFENDIRDTYFQVTFPEGGGRALSLLHPIGTNRLNEIQESLGIGWWNGMIMILVNDDRLGGTSTIATRGSDHFGIVAHELGHQFAQLADEYEEEGRGPLWGQNVTTATTRDLIPWRHWIEDSTPVPTPVDVQYFDKVGLFEGANYQRNGWFRPQIGCKMRYNSDPFCVVCSELIIGKIYTSYNANRILSVYPEPGDIHLQLNQNIQFSYTGPQPEHGLTLNWKINGHEYAVDAIDIQLSGSILGVGTHRVELLIIDETEAVRHPAHKPNLTLSKVWDVVVSDALSTHRPAESAAGMNLSNGYPNPAREHTTVTFTLHNPQSITVSVYDVLGRKVTDLASGLYPAGEHRVSWSTVGIARGMYFYRLTSGNSIITRTLMLVR